MEEKRLGRPKGTKKIEEGQMITFVASKELFEFIKQDCKNAIDERNVSAYLRHLLEARRKERQIKL